MEKQKQSRRLLSLDALRGFDMFFIMGGASLFVALATLFPNSFFQAIGGHTTTRFSRCFCSLPASRFRSRWKSSANRGRASRISIKGLSAEELRWCCWDVSITDCYSLTLRTFVAPASWRVLGWDGCLPPCCSCISGLQSGRG